ncbi:MAG: ATP-binding protein [Actinobacteria bacterium]|nr:ATP-binding protein [Actinomycetota bacterium]
MTAAHLPPAPVLDELVSLCRRLRLKYVREQMPDVLATAKAQRWDPAEALRVLLHAEAEGRDRAGIENRRKQARFPTGKTFHIWDETRTSIPTATQHGLRSLEWVTRAENLVVCGPSGTGKSHFCEALGQHAVDQGLTVAWYSIEDLGTLVRRHRVDDSIPRAFHSILRSDLICVDDIGLLPISTDAAEGFYRLIDVCYEQRSVTVSSNLHPSAFDQLIDKNLASALVDRLMHHAHVIVTEGDSIRLTDATSRKGVQPLTH